MRITELLQDATIDLGVKVNSKEEAIDHLVDLMVKGGNITDREEFKKGILAREANGTTGIGGGIAIPHSKNKAVTKAGLASMTVRRKRSWRRRVSRPRPMRSNAACR